MDGYHINGNTIHSGLHIDINKKELTPLNQSELNTLGTKYCKLKFVLYDEASMIGRNLFTKSEKKIMNNYGNQENIWWVTHYSH